jgi:hypothetical protein
MLRSQSEEPKTIEEAHQRVKELLSESSRLLDMIAKYPVDSEGRFKPRLVTRNGFPFASVTGPWR